MRGPLFLIAFVFGISLAAMATKHVIYFSYPAYSPSGLSVFVGDTILWKGPFDKFPLAATSIPAGASSFGNEQGADFTYVVTVPGTYKYQCPAYKTEGMNGYFIALVQDKTIDQSVDNAMVYINFVSHAFHVTTPTSVAHETYAITITSSTGKVIYTGELKPDENDKWIATEEFPSGSYVLAANDGKHSFSRKFSK